MKKIDKFNNHTTTYTFSFMLRTQNPFEKMILDRLNHLIDSGCTQKDAIITLMAKSVIDNVNSDASVCKSVQSNMDINKTDRKIQDTNKEIKYNQQSQLHQKNPVNEPEKKLNNTDKYNTPETESKLQGLLQGMYK